MIFFGYTERHFDYTLPSFQASTAGLRESGVFPVV